MRSHDRGSLIRVTICDYESRLEEDTLLENSEGTVKIRAISTDYVAILEFASEDY